MKNLKLNKMDTLIDFDKYYNSFITDINDDKYSNIIWFLKNKDGTYIGNKQIDFNEETNDINILNKDTQFIYWFGGNGSRFSVLHIYNHTSNRNKKNQKILNVIKSDAVEYYKTTCNIKQMRTTENDVTKFFGKDIERGKKYITDYLINTETFKIKESIIKLIDNILHKSKWINFLHVNRFTILYKILYGQLDDDIKQQLINCILFKDIIYELLINNRLIYTRNMLEKYLYNYSMHYQKCKYMPFGVKNSVNLFLSLQYKNYDNKTEEKYKKITAAIFRRKRNIWKQNLIS